MTTASRPPTLDQTAPRRRREVVAVCNTRPDNVTPNSEASPEWNSDVSVIASGIDTLYLFSRAPVAHTEVRRLEDAQQEARANPDRLAKGPTLDVAGHYFTMNRHGARTAPYLLDSEHASLLVNPSAASTFPTFAAELRALYLWQKGARFAAEHAEEIATRLLMRITADDARLLVSRVDLAVDFQGWEPREADGPEFVTRAHDRTSHVQRKVFTGFMFGRGDVGARLYCKSIEIERSHKKWFREVWSKSAAYDPKRPVWRLEFQLRRPAIVRMELGDERASLDTWEDVLGNAGALWRYLSRNWLALKRRTKKSRQNFHPAWDALASLGFRSGPWKGTDADLYRAHREDAAHRLTAQLAGYLARGYAEEMFFSRDRGPGELDPFDFETAVPRIVARARQHAERRGESIESKAENRLAAWDLAHEQARVAHEPGSFDGEDDMEAA